MRIRLSDSNTLRLRGNKLSPPNLKADRPHHASWRNFRGSASRDRPEIMNDISSSLRLSVIDHKINNG